MSDKQFVHLERRRVHAADPCVLVVFGAGGDLTHRKLMPAVLNLDKSGLLPQKFVVVGVSRDVFSPENVSERFLHFQGDLLNDESYKELKDYLDEVHKKNQTGGNCIFYLATPPQLFSEISDRLARVGLNEEDHGWRRIVVEKPFGRDLQSAVLLNEALKRSFKEEQIYRIDHYLGKETVQNLLVFRFANGMFEPIWNRRYVDSVQITVAETLGVEHRAAYYEKAGALRDMVSSHLLQLLCLIAMEPPTSFSADDVRGEKVKTLKAIRPIRSEDVPMRSIRAQYDSYRAEVGVSPQSKTETYAALRLELDNWRWAGVPFYLRTGKHLGAAVTEIAVQFKSAPLELFREVQSNSIPPNLLLIQIAPKEGIRLDFTAKVPGPQIDLGEVQMRMDYAESFGHQPSTGYETLLYDVMIGDQTNFRTSDQVLQSWKAIMPILDAWSAESQRRVPSYKSGSAGPSAADDLIQADGRRWRAIGQESEVSENGENLNQESA